ncbi:MAG: cytochrome b [Thalassobaculum sp.]|uniref:cytochrome b n=1 Tax=Thalassobaculum sp. TaxID=2022740 RepID=UPI0032F00EAE
MNSDGSTGYAGVQKLLHWLMAALVIVMIVVGLSLPRMGPGPLTNTLYEVHKSTGMLVLALALVRLALRWRLGAPPLDPGLPAWQRRAAAASHGLLYVLLILVPIAGWAATSACCRPVNFLWTVPATLPVPADNALAKQIFLLHFGMAFALAGLVAVHVAAALHHHLVRRDDTLRRMLPGRPDRP